MMQLTIIKTHERKIIEMIHSTKLWVHTITYEQ